MTWFFISFSSAISLIKEIIELIIGKSDSNLHHSACFKLMSLGWRIFLESIAEKWNHLSFLLAVFLPLRWKKKKEAIFLGLNSRLNNLFRWLLLAADPYRRKSIRHHAHRKEARAGGEILLLMTCLCVPGPEGEVTGYLNRDKSVCQRGRDWIWLKPHGNRPGLSDMER